MKFSVTIELPDDVGNKVLKSVAERHSIGLSEIPTQAEIDRVSQAVALEIYQKEKLAIAEKAATTAFNAVMDEQSHEPMA